MSEQKELCPKCGSAAFGILRDMTSRRVCKCSHSWAAPEKKDTGYKKLKRESEEYFTKWGEYMKRAHVAEAKVDELKSKLEKAEKVISFYADENNWKTMEHCESDTISKIRVQAQDYDSFGVSEYGEASKLILLGGKQAREYMKGEG